MRDPLELVTVECNNRSPTVQGPRIPSKAQATPPLPLPLHVHHIPDDADLVYGHILSDGPTQQLASADVELCEMEGTLHDMPRHPAPGQRCSLVPTGILEGV